MSEMDYIRVLGHGNFGTVFLMRHAGTGTLVAMKQMSKFDICKYVSRCDE
jgi:serine/threonine protein kinase